MNNKITVFVFDRKGWYFFEIESFFNGKFESKIDFKRIIKNDLKKILNKFIILIIYDSLDILYLADLLNANKKIIVLFNNISIYIDFISANSKYLNTILLTTNETHRERLKIYITLNNLINDIYY